MRWSMHWLWGAFVATTFAASGCGGGGSSGALPGEGNPEAGASFDATAPGSLFPGDGSTTTAEGGTSLCTAQTCASTGTNCGPVADGCGGIIQCGSCGAGESCGGGGTPNVCSVGPACKPKTCADPGLAGSCGPQGDGCGGFLAAPCVTCAAPQTCGGGSTPSQCGGSSGDGGTGVCTKIPQGTACAGHCGPESDGCGGAYVCGGCATPGDTCGGGGTPSVCGHPPCTPLTACPSSVNCGPWPTGCGSGVIPSCGTCTKVGDTCGGGGTPSVCGQPACVALTACPAGKDCGTWPDGCGKFLTCGTHGGGCVAPQICGGGGVPSQCGDGAGDGGACTGVACNVQACPGKPATSISGHVYDPAGNDPLYNVVVYVPQAAPDVFAHGPSCDTCGSLYTGQPLVATVTDAKGFFTLPGVPVMAHMPLVIQIGKWRRQMSIATILPCQDNPQPDKSLKLPSQQNNTGAGAGGPPYEGTGTVDDLPQIAISTGGADTLECLLQRVGVNPAEYASGAGGAGHLHIFTGNSNDPAGAPAPTRPASPASLSKLWDTAADMNPYDIVILSCEGQETQGVAGGGGLTAAQLTVLKNYADTGGRVFASHFHYAWFNHGAFNTANLATWTPNSNPITDVNGNDFANTDVVTTLADGGVFPRGQALHDFLKNVNALGPANAVATPADGTGADQLNIESPRHNADVSAANTPSQPWLVADGNNSNPGATEYFSFDSPVGGTGDPTKPYCGRVVFSDLHVGAASKDYSTSPDNAHTPTGCTPAKLSPQERALEFMLFDLSSCPSTQSNLPPPTCTPLTSCPASVKCGPYPNGCATGNLNCGTCPNGESCVDGQCAGCVPLTACPAGQACGTYPNGCGTGTITCGTCPVNASCVAGHCVTCVPATTCPTTQTCGQWPDGCGGAITCGTCPAGLVCNGGKCAGGCTPTGCPPGVDCGQVADGCGGLTTSCGTCTGNATCGGGGTSNQCGLPPCTPRTCQQANANCGPIGDGCGSVLQCGTCTPPDTCGGGGVGSVCGRGGPPK